MRCMIIRACSVFDFAPRFLKDDFETPGNIADFCNQMYFKKFFTSQRDRPFPSCCFPLVQNEC